MLHSFIFVRSSLKPVQQLTLCHTNQWRNTSSISALQAAFRDPSSPFHIPPGEKGPESPDAPPSHATLRALATMENTMDPLEEAQEKLSNAGFDPASFWEQRIVWGDHDSFQHVNNVHYGTRSTSSSSVEADVQGVVVRFFESGRIKWMTSLGEELGGHARTTAMLKGQGVSLILKSIEVQYRRPVTYPDTLLIGYRPVPSSLSKDVEDPATFYVAASAYSLTQKAFVAHAKEALVWYDYDKLKKCDPGEHAREVIAGRVRKQ